VIRRITDLLKNETAGDPMHGLKWTRRATRKIAGELHRVKIQIGATTVGRLLKQMGFSLRVNHKRLESGNPNPPPRRVRNRQFLYIGRKREAFTARGYPVISVDAKKKEMVGNFKNPGRSWGQEPYEVKDHDFRGDAQGMAIPYGIYDPRAQRGFVVVGTSHETSLFAVEAIELWWKNDGRRRYRAAKKLLLLADCGGSNSARSRGWKYQLQHRLCNSYGLHVTVCHYPPGASKWNPIEHRLFSEISKNWAGKPLKSYETVLKYIRTTTTSRGLKVRACLLRKKYAKGQAVSNNEMQQLMLNRHQTLPQWNYTLTPSRM
jgi:Rhodopirellula transposase DDE domain